MRSNALARTLVSAAAVVGLAAGGLATAGTSFAAPASATSARTVTIKATNNLGLNTTEGKSVQCYVRDASPVGKFDPGTIDGQLGTKSWKAWQAFLNDRGYNAGTVDGDPGPNTIRGLQRFLVYIGYDTGGIDGDAGPKTRAAWKAFANLGGGWC